MRVEVQDDMKRYDRKTVEVFEFHFDKDDGSLTDINQSVYIDGTGDGTPETTIVSKREVEVIAAVPHKYVDMAREKLQAAVESL